jgi:hypothetical protein
VYVGVRPEIEQSIHREIPVTFTPQRVVTTLGKLTTNALPRSTPALRVLRGIVQQVAEHLRNPHRITLDHDPSGHHGPLEALQPLQHGLAPASAPDPGNPPGAAPARPP